MADWWSLLNMFAPRQSAPSQTRPLPWHRAGYYGGIAPGEYAYPNAVEPYAPPPPPSAPAAGGMSAADIEADYRAGIANPARGGLLDGEMAWPDDANVGGLHDNGGDVPSKASPPPPPPAEYSRGGGRPHAASIAPSAPLPSRKPAFTGSAYDLTPAQVSTTAHGERLEDEIARLRLMGATQQQIADFASTFYGR